VAKLVRLILNLNNFAMLQKKEIKRNKMYFIGKKSVKMCKIIFTVKITENGNIFSEYILKRG